MRNITDHSPFFVAFGENHIVSFYYHFVLVKEANRRRIYAHCVSLDDEAEKDEKPKLMWNEDDPSLSDLDIKRGFVLQLPHQQFIAEATQYIWSNVASKEEYQEQIELNKFNSHMRNTITESMPNALIQSILKLGIEASPFMEMYQWRVQCPLPNTLRFPHWIIIDATEDGWHCGHCKREGKTNQIWIDHPLPKKKN